MYWIIIAIKIISIVNCETRYISASLDCYSTPTYFGTTISFADRLYYSKTADPIIYDDEDSILTVDYNTDDLTTIGKPACTIYYAHNNTHSVTWQGPVSLRQLPVECTLLDKEYCFENKNPLSNIKGGMMCCCKDDLCNYGSSSFFIFFGRLDSPRKIDNTMKELSPLLKGAALSTIIILVATFISCLEYVVRMSLSRFKSKAYEMSAEDTNYLNRGFSRDFPVPVDTEKSEVKDEQMKNEQQLNKKMSSTDQTAVHTKAANTRESDTKNDVESTNGDKPSFKKKWKATKDTLQGTTEGMSFNAPSNAKKPKSRRKLKQQATLKFEKTQQPSNPEISRDLEKRKKQPSLKRKPSRSLKPSSSNEATGLSKKRSEQKSLAKSKSNDRSLERLPPEGTQKESSMRSMRVASKTQLMPLSKEEITATNQKTQEDSNRDRDIENTMQSVG